MGGMKGQEDRYSVATMGAPLAEECLKDMVAAIEKLRDAPFFLKPREETILVPPSCLCQGCGQVFCPGGRVVSLATYDDGREVPEVVCHKCGGTTPVVVAPKEA